MHYVLQEFIQLEVRISDKALETRGILICSVSEMRL